MKFKYFRDSENFAFRVGEKSKCSLCEKVGLWFDAVGYYGLNEIECICDSCLAEGKLKELEIETNEATEGSIEEIETIIYKTPSLPTWQDREWPYVNNQYCVFERMASKEDFHSKEEFKGSFMGSDIESTDFNWLWAILPEKKIANLKEGNFDVSVYLFTLSGKKYCTWDAS